MKYVYAVLIPLLFQVLVVWLVIEMNTGNGSFVGLGAYLLGLVAIPLTAIINAIIVYNSPKIKLSVLTFRSMMLALLLPVLVILISVFG